MLVQGCLGNVSAYVKNFMHGPWTKQQLIVLGQIALWISYDSQHWIRGQNSIRLMKCIYIRHEIHTCPTWHCWLAGHVSCTIGRDLWHSSLHCWNRVVQSIEQDLYQRLCSYSRWRLVKPCYCCSRQRITVNDFFHCVIFETWFVEGSPKILPTLFKQDVHS